MNRFILFIGCTLLTVGCQSPITESSSLMVWTEGVPGSIDDPGYRTDTIFVDESSPRILKVTNPTLEVFHAPVEKSTGTAVVICPGGGYGRLAIDHEGYKVAAWLNENGITGIILTYRLPSDAIMEDKSIGPLQDAQEAVRIVRRHSGEWNIDPARIGIMGFSAGGHLASTLSTHYNELVYPPADETSARPDFSILIYPVITMNMDFSHRGSRENLLGKDPPSELVQRFSNELHVGPDTSPAFLVHSSDDRSVLPENSIRYMQALMENDIPAELHLYESGGHGYGLGKSHRTESTWPDACLNWLRLNKFSN